MSAAVVSTHRPLWVRTFEGAALAGAVILLSAQASRVFHAAWISEAWPLLLLSCPLGIAAADFVSGAVHWACDRFGDERSGVLGPNLIAAFREHHRDPRAILGHAFVERTGYNASTIAVPLLIAPMVAGPESGDLALAGHSFLLFLTAGVLLTNEFHMWAHARRAPALIRCLQAAGLILSPEHHAEHHRRPFARRYCVTTGWMNPILDGLGFWSHCEGWLRGSARNTSLASQERS